MRVPGLAWPSSRGRSSGWVVNMASNQRWAKGAAFGSSSPQHNHQRPMPLEKELTILLVEDLRDDAFFFRHALRKTKLPATLHVAENGSRAIEYLSNQGRFVDVRQYPRPEIVFIDLRMPEVDGFELLEWISKAFAGAPFQAVVLTSSDDPQDYQKALELGAHGYILKPILPERLSEVL